MLDTYLGQDVFLDGVASYLNAFKYSEKIVLFVCWLQGSDTIVRKCFVDRFMGTSEHGFRQGRRKVHGKLTSNISQRLMN